MNRVTCRVSFDLSFDETQRFPGAVHTHGPLDEDVEAWILMKTNLCGFLVESIERIGVEMSNLQVDHMTVRDDFVLVRKRVLEWCKEHAREDLWYGSPYAWWNAARKAGIVNDDEMQRAQQHFGYAWHYRGD